MSRQETILNVPNADIARIQTQYRAAGATVVVSPNSGGQTSKVMATFAAPGHQEIIHDVPNADVPRVKVQYEAAEATVTVSPQADGMTSTVVATFP